MRFRAAQALWRGARTADAEAQRPRSPVSPMPSRNFTRSKEKPAMAATEVKEAKARQKAALDTPTNLTTNATTDLSGAINALLADTFALYVKTKNFHWHMSGPHFRDYHLLLDEQGEQIFATTD